MTYTEIKERNNKKYYYRTLSIRNYNKFSKKRIYLGAGLSKKELDRLEQKADKKLLQQKIKDNIKFIKLKIIPILKKYNVKKAGVFGSYADGKQKKASDVDILIEPPKGAGFDFIDIEDDIKLALDKKIDLVTYKGLNPLLKEKILNQEIRLL
ncbi:hypothetical protein HN510_05135 [Candidatus Woesearchaeota archaeon]|jgi:uncharacterized protein|nr:hypothetical protein [Candidatus Woesearchaeota archaeon]